MQHLRSLFWFLLTILSILSVSGFLLISVGSQISAAPPSYKRVTSKCSFYQKALHYLTLTKLNCIWDKYICIEAIQIISSSGIHKTDIYHNGCYLQLFVFKFQMNNSSFFEKDPPSFKCYPLITPPVKAYYIARSQAILNYDKRTLFAFLIPLTYLC